MPGLHADTITIDEFLDLISTEPQPESINPEPVTPDEVQGWVMQAQAAVATQNALTFTADRMELRDAEGVVRVATYGDSPQFFMNRWNVTADLAPPPVLLTDLPSAPAPEPIKEKPKAPFQAKDPLTARTFIAQEVAAIHEMLDWVEKTFPGRSLRSNYGMEAEYGAFWRETALHVQPYLILRDIGYQPAADMEFGSLARTELRAGNLFLYFCAGIGRLTECWERIDRLTEYKYSKTLVIHADRCGPASNAELYLYDHDIGGLDGTGDHHRIPELNVPRSYLQVASVSGYRTAIDMDMPLWGLREALRLERGVYIPLPDEFMAMMDPEKLKGVYPHMASKVSNKGMIAFTQSPTAGMMDRQQVMKAGRFARQFGREDLTDADIKHLSALAMTALPFSFDMTLDRDLVREIYCEGPESCMGKGSISNTMDKFRHTYVDGDWVAPAEVYCHPESNLRLAYLKTDAGRYAARAWVNIERKEWIRIYTSNGVLPGAERLMKDWFEDLGYGHNRMAAQGEPMLLLHTDDAGAIICPYIDADNMGVEVLGDRLIIGHGECTEADHETGCLIGHRVDSDWNCYHCDRGMSDYDTSYLTVGNEVVCEYCCDTHYHRVHNLDECEDQYASDDCSANVYDVSYNSDGIRNNCEDLVYTTDLCRHHMVVLSSDFYHADSHATDCAAHRDQCVELDDGDYVLSDDLEENDLVLCQGKAYSKSDMAIIVLESGTPYLVRYSDLRQYDCLEIEAGAYEVELPEDNWHGIDVFAETAFLKQFEAATAEEESV
ncbi:hypothetical protein VPH49_21825 [Pseudomonas luteola]|uniref:hypothetical protein n=1 Tax=Pseudomonas luteola TaxID=47886 RepID=UPI003A8C65B3